MSTGFPNTNYANTGSSKTSLIYSGEQAAVDEGSYFIATNPTPGTAIATTTSVVDDATGATTHAQQKPVMSMQNQSAAGSNINIYLRYIKMFIVQVPSSATQWRYAFRLDANPAKITTAGTSIIPVSNVSPNTVNSKAVIGFGAITAADSTSGVMQRIVGNGLVSGAVPVANDEWLFTFGDPARSIDSIGTQTLLKRLTIPCAPIVIPPQFTLTLEMWGASNAAAPSWEFEMGWIERPTGM